MDTVTFRLPEELIARLEAFVAKMNETRRGTKYNRSDAVRDSLEAGLKAEGF